MSTAAGLTLLMRAHQRKVDAALGCYREAIAESIMRPMIRRLWWFAHLQDAADATRYQLTWNGKR